MNTGENVFVKFMAIAELKGVYIYTLNGENNAPKRDSLNTQGTLCSKLVR